MCTVKLMLLLVVLFNFTFPASFAPNPYSGKPPIDPSNDGVNSSGNGVVNQRKYATGSARGGGGGGVGGGRSAGESSSGNGGQSSSSPRGGGGTVVPVYAAGAGAAAQRKNHHSAADICNIDRLLIVTATVLISLLPYLCM